MSRINREDFLNTLNMVKAGLAAREEVQQSSCFCFQNSMVHTFNDEISCRVKTGLDITGAVPASTLLDILGKVNDAELLVSESESEIEFKGKGKVFAVTKESEVQLPIDRVEMPEKWATISPQFADSIAMVQHCAGSDESDFKMVCIHMTPEFVEACDNFQAMRARFETGLKAPVLVRASSLGHLVSLGMESFSTTRAWIHFKNPAGLIMSCRKETAEEYPDLSPALLLKKGHAITIPKGLSEAAERAAVFAVNKSQDPLITLSLKEGKIRVAGEGVTGRYRQSKSIAYSGPAMEFMISPFLLKHVCDRYQEAQISNVPNHEKLKVTGANWEYITVLSNPEDAKSKEEKEA